MRLGRLSDWKMATAPPRDGNACTSGTECDGTERSHSVQMLFPTPVLATPPPPFTADDGRRQRWSRGPLMTRSLCPATHDTACSSVANPLTIVGFMPGIETSTAYSIPSRERIRYVASACGCLGFPMPVIAHQLPLERSCSTAATDRPWRGADRWRRFFSSRMLSRKPR